MKKDNLKSVISKEDLIFKYYLKTKNFFRAKYEASIPYMRRLIRFLALPYCYLKLVNWEECSASRLQVAKDFFYIFFRLKYFPDNYSLCRFWEKDRDEWKYYYGSIYDPFQRARVRKELQRREYQILFDDKYVCYELCKAAGLPIPEQYGCIEPEMDYRTVIFTILKRNLDKKIIIKPVIGRGGEGVCLAYYNSGEVFVRSMSRTTNLDSFILHSKSVIQEYVKQHGEVSKISPSINTIRLATLYTKNKDVLIIGGEFRFGVDDAFLDNTSAGGITVGMDLETGITKSIASDFSSRTYSHHPTTGFEFEGFKIPYWGEVINLAKKTQSNFYYYKLLGLDIAITPVGPVLIEINASHDNVGLEQVYGPILANPLVLKEFKEYDLLINKMFC